ncbi:hypothetical protein [Streptomyces sp. NPDC088789]|uniref:hypothetical protein n=1 Tax=Streptomyces sp. NPDC088789 TaxID=3365899 RepID=UPI0037FCCA62
MLLALVLQFGRLAVRWALPAMVGEFMVGVLLGPSLLERFAPAPTDWLFPKDPGQFHLLDAFSQIGLLLLVGVTGTQLNLGLLRRQGTTACWPRGATGPSARTDASPPHGISDRRPAPGTGPARTPDRARRAGSPGGRTLRRR